MKIHIEETGADPTAAKHWLIELSSALGAVLSDPFTTHAGALSTSPAAMNSEGAVSTWTAEDFCNYMPGLMGIFGKGESRMYGVRKAFWAALRVTPDYVTFWERAGTVAQQNVIDLYFNTRKDCSVWFEDRSEGVRATLASNDDPHAAARTLESFQVVAVAGLLSAVLTTVVDNWTEGTVLRSFPPAREWVAEKEPKDPVPVEKLVDIERECQDTASMERTLLLKLLFGMPGSTEMGERLLPKGWEEYKQQAEDFFSGMAAWAKTCTDFTIPPSPPRTLPLPLEQLIYTSKKPNPVKLHQHLWAAMHTVVFDQFIQLTAALGNKLKKMEEDKRTRKRGNALREGFQEEIRRIPEQQPARHMAVDKVVRKYAREAGLENIVDAYAEAEREAWANLKSNLFKVLVVKVKIWHGPV